MSKHSTSALTMRDALYEAPGPKMRAKIRIGTAISLVAVAALAILVLQRFYVTGQLSVHYWYFFTHLTTWKFLLAGFEGTVKVALTAGAIALVLGLALMLGRTSGIKPLQLVCRVLTDFFRGVPSLLFIYFFFLVLPQYKIALPSFWMLTLPVALAAAGVLAEIFRAGIQSIEVGQMRAGLSLGMTWGQTMRYIILPQAFKRIIPPLGNEFIAMLKDSSLVSVIGFEELTRTGQLIIAETYGSLEIWTSVAIIYLVMTLTITRLVSRLEKKFKASDAR